MRDVRSLGMPLKSTKKATRPQSATAHRAAGPSESELELSRMQIVGNHSLGISIT